MGWMKKIALYPPTDQGILPSSAVIAAATPGKRHRMSDAFFAARYVTALVLSFALSSWVPGAARAQNYPVHSVKIIVPFAAGGTADAVPRLVGDWLSRKWGQPVIIENRTGA